MKIDRHLMLSDKEADAIMRDKHATDDQLAACKYKFRSDARSLFKNKNRDIPAAHRKFDERQKQRKAFDRR